MSIILLASFKGRIDSPNMSLRWYDFMTLLELGPYWITNLVSGDDSLLLHPGTWSSMSIGILGASQLWFKAYQSVYISEEMSTQYPAKRCKIISSWVTPYQTLSWRFTPWAFSRCFKEKNLSRGSTQRNGKPTTVRSSTVRAIYLNMAKQHPKKERSWESHLQKSKVQSHVFELSIFLVCQLSRYLVAVHHLKGYKTDLPICLCKKNLTVLVSNQHQHQRQMSNVKQNPGMTFHEILIGW